MGGARRPVALMAVRAQGNTAEYAAMLALLIYLLGQRSSAEWVSWVMVGVTASRYLLVIGVLASATLARPNPFRAVGALGGTVLALALLFCSGIDVVRNGLGPLCFGRGTTHRP
nr:MAPEG family protein [Diaphorobacter sp.]